MQLFYKAGATWNPKISEWFPEAFARNIPQDFLAEMDEYHRRIAIEFKDTDLHNSLMGKNKGGKLGIELQESYILRELGFDEVWVIYVHEPDLTWTDLEMLESICFRKAFVKGYESKDSALRSIRDMLNTHHPDAKPIAYINQSDLPTILHRMVAQIAGVGQIGQDAVTYVLSRYDPHSLIDALEGVDRRLRELDANDNRSRIFNEYLTTLQISQIGQKKTKRSAKI